MKFKSVMFVVISVSTIVHRALLQLHYKADFSILKLAFSLQVFPFNMRDNCDCSELPLLPHHHFAALVSTKHLRGLTCTFDTKNIL